MFGDSFWYFKHVIVITNAQTIKIVRFECYNNVRKLIKENPIWKTIENLSGKSSYISFYPQPLPPNLNIEKHPIIDMVNSAIALGLSRNDMANYISMLVSKDILKYYAKSGKKTFVHLSWISGYPQKRYRNSVLRVVQTKLSKVLDNWGILSLFGKNQVLHKNTWFLFFI